MSSNNINICIYENQYEEIRDSVDLCNVFYFNNTLNISHYPSSDSIPISELEKYYLILVDLDLSPKGTSDGIGLIKKIKNQFPNMKIGIITGATFVKDKLDENELADIMYLIKPFDYADLNNFFRRFNIIPVS